MSPEQLLAFVGISLAVAVVPGPDMALIARNVVRYGRSAGYATSLGVCTGILGWGLAAAVGVAALLATSATAFTALKLAGAAYLIYLGITTLRGRDLAVDVSGPRGSPVPWGRPYAQGVVSALLNPKLGVFFLTLLPQFVTPGEASAIRAFQLAVLFDLIGFLWLLAYSAMLAAVSATLARPAAQRTLRAITGTVLVGLGARVAVERS